MGVTGTGKSSFIADYIDRPVDDQMIGHGLRSRKLQIHSVLLYVTYILLGTGRVVPHTCKYNDHTVHLIDTPGFDDTSLSDTDVLAAVAQCIQKTYSVEGGNFESRRQHGKEATKNGEGAR